MDFYEENIRLNNERVAELEAKYKAMKAKYIRARNELCNMCGKYGKSHLGACDGCAFKEI